MHPRNSVVYIVCIHAYYIVGLRETKKNRIQGGGDRFSVHFAEELVSARNNNNKGNRSNVNKHELDNGEYSSNARYARCLFIICVIVYNLYYCCYAKLVLQQFKNVTAKCTENLSPPPCILYLLAK